MDIKDNNGELLFVLGTEYEDRGGWVTFYEYRF